MGADCKSAGLRLQWFKSTIYHKALVRYIGLEKK
jgi:hypothetical protein